MSEIPGPGDRRYPTIGGTLFVLTCFWLAAAALHLWQGWWWAYIGAGVLTVYFLSANLLIVRRFKRFGA